MNKQLDLQYLIKDDSDGSYTLIYERSILFVDKNSYLKKGDKVDYLWPEDHPKPRKYTGNIIEVSHDEEKLLKMLDSLHQNDIKNKSNFPKKKIEGKISKKQMESEIKAKSKSLVQDLILQKIDFQINSSDKVSATTSSEISDPVIENTPSSNKNILSRIEKCRGFLIAGVHELTNLIDEISGKEESDASIQKNPTPNRRRSTKAIFDEKNEIERENEENVIFSQENLTEIAILEACNDTFKNKNKKINNFFSKSNFFKPACSTLNDNRRSEPSVEICHNKRRSTKTINSFEDDMSFANDNFECNTKSSKNTDFEDDEFQFEDEKTKTLLPVASTSFSTDSILPSRKRIRTISDDTDENDLNKSAKWTLKYQKADKEQKIIELLPGSEVFIKLFALKNLLETCNRQTTLARALMECIFTAEALSSCSLRGRKANNASNIDDKRPGLYYPAVATILSYTRRYAKEKQWPIKEDQVILASLRQKLIEMKDKKIMNKNRSNV